jgi:hypothetical protein
MSITEIKEELVEAAKEGGCYSELINDHTGFNEAIREIAAGRETVAGVIDHLLFNQEDGR